MSTITPDANEVNKKLEQIKLRPYQQIAIMKLREKLFSGQKKILIMSATGSGKTAMMATIANMTLSKGNKILTVMYGSDLVLQTARVYKKYYGFESSITMGSLKQFESNSIVGSISTLNRRNLPDVDIVILDEAHNKYDKIIEHYKDKIIIAFSATPFSNCHHYEDYIIVASISDLIRDGHLVKPRHFAPRSQIDTSKIKTIAGEYENESLANEALKITGDIIAEWRVRGESRPTIAFCVNVKHSKELADQFNINGIKAIHLDANDSNDLREECLNKLKNGEIKIITNVAIFTTGVDLPEISCVINARPTKSEILYVQTNGRGLRPAPNKNDCIIIDHANNVSRFGLLTEDRQPVITPKEKKKKSKDDVKEIKVWLCPLCFYTNPHNATACEDCETPKPIKITEVKQSSGELEEITAPLKNKKRKLYLGNVMPFGKYNGTAFENLPYSYLEWASANLSDDSRGVRHRLELELERIKKL